MKFYCVGDEDTVRGFRLAGVEGRTAATAEEAGEAVSEAAAKADCGVLILSQRLASLIRPRVDELRARDRPLIVEIPGPDGPLPGRKSLREFVQEAVGVGINQEKA